MCATPARGARSAFAAIAAIAAGFEAANPRPAIDCGEKWARETARFSASNDAGAETAVLNVGSKFS